jgi:sensor histidine kinase regulating citrate/malate metabolism
MTDMGNVSERDGKMSGKPQLWWRIVVLLILVFSSTLLLISFLNFSNYRKTYLNLSQTRYLVSAKELRQSIEYGMSIGLPPSSNGNLLPALNELLKRQSGILYVAIIDDLGNVISAGTTPASGAGEWRALQESTSADSYWKTATPNAYQIGIPFANNFNAKAGSVVVGYDRVLIEKSVDSMMYKIGFQLAASLGILTILTVAIVYFLTRKFSDTLSRISSIIGRASHGDEACEVADVEIESGTARELSDFVNVSRQAARELALLESEMGMVPGWSTT